MVEQLALLEELPCARSCVGGLLIFPNGGAAWCAACPAGRAGLARMRARWDEEWRALLAGFERRRQEREREGSPDGQA